MLIKKLSTINMAFTLSLFVQLALVIASCVVVYENENNSNIQNNHYDLIVHTEQITNHNSATSLPVKTYEFINDFTARQSNLLVSESDCSLFTTFTTETTEEIKYYDIYSSINKEEVIIYSLSLPQHNTDFKAFMDYRCLTDTTSEQWKLSQIAYTDKYGLRKVDDYYCVAMGSYYSSSVGDKFKITLENGNEFNVIIGDLKQDCHTDSKNQYTPVYDNSGNFYGANVLEFIIDEDIVDEMVLTLGTVSYYEQFEGNITDIKKD